MFSIPSDLGRRALEAAPDAIVIIDAAGVIEFANRQVSALFGFSHAEIVGQSVGRLMPERFRNRGLLYDGRYTRKVRGRAVGQCIEVLGRRSDGTEFPIEISLSPIEDGGRVLLAAAIRDMSDQKRAEAELSVARQAAERARESADRANRGKSRFLATASHDLRQPLQTLALLNGALRRTVSDPRATEALSQQEQAIGAMSRLVNALLDISKLESGAVRPELTDFALAAVFEDLRVEFGSVAADKGLTLDIGNAGACVHSDPLLVEQILRNLVSNAIKYTRQGRVSLRCSADQDSIIRVEVLDTGMGIPADQIGHICDEFYQVGVPANSSRNGYGLGLSIVQRIVELLNLRLDVRSEVGRGSSFSLVLPRANGRVTAVNRDSEAPCARHALLGRPRVLLVEDDAGVRDATRMLLKVEGYRVTAVASMSEALQEGRKDGGIDLLVTDYHLRDGETGLQVISELRTILGYPLQAVLITGDTSAAIRQLPPDPDLRIASKPLNAEELLRLLRDLLASERVCANESSVRAGPGVPSACALGSTVRMD